MTEINLNPSVNIRINVRAIDTCLTSIIIYSVVNYAQELFEKICTLLDWEYDKDPYCEQVESSSARFDIPCF